MKQYNLIVVGNGIAAKCALFEFFQTVKQSQNFSVAQIYSEELAPSCTLRTTSTVSLNGVEPGVSELGDLLRSGFFAFEEFFNTHKPLGVYPIKQVNVIADPTRRPKMIRRFKELDIKSHNFLKVSLEGVELNSYVVIPEELCAWLDDKNLKNKIEIYNDLIIETQTRENKAICLTSNGLKLTADKLLICAGAYAKINEDYFPPHEVILNSQVVAGSYGIRKINLGKENYYLTLDGHSVIYRASTQELVVGSSTVFGNDIHPDLGQLEEILVNLQPHLNLDLGKIADYEIFTGVRHKGKKKLPFLKVINESTGGNIFMIGGLFKNGFSMPFFYAKKFSELFL